MPTIRPTTLRRSGRTEFEVKRADRRGMRASLHDLHRRLVAEQEAGGAGAGADAGGGAPVATIDGWLHKKKRRRGALLAKALANPLSQWNRHFCVASGHYLVYYEGAVFGEHKIEAAFDLDHALQVESGSALWLPEL